MPAAELYERLAVEDVTRAADVLRPVFDRTGGKDGFVSLEVSPRLAHDTAGTVAEAHRLWDAVDRPNLLIKVPATTEGIPAIEELLASGINVNITLMFSMAHYEAVAQAYLRALGRAPDHNRLASVASVFVEPDRHRGRSAPRRGGHARGEGAEGSGRHRQLPRALRPVPGDLRGPPVCRVGREGGAPPTRALGEHEHEGP